MNPSPSPLRPAAFAATLVALAACGGSAALALTVDDPGPRLEFESRKRSAAAATG